ncbi:MAG: rod shape-determining protein MreD [Coriobacteriales bacterium]|jgi:rod shape-determining protein MreD|nr:rod shape-determining protein MreD [Coriobacteriales bacterium]
MSPTTTRAVRTLIIGLTALLAQIIIAPNIRVANIVPDLVLVTVIIQAIRLPLVPATVFGFASGLLFDLISSGPFGLMALILTILALAISSLNKGTFTEHWVVEMLLVILATLFGELLYGVGQALVNPDLDFTGSLLHIVLPTTLYDAVLGLVFLLCAHLLGRRTNNGGGRFSDGPPPRAGGRLSGAGGRPFSRKIKQPGKGGKLHGRPLNRKLH